jgi:hypothetical protein
MPPRAATSRVGFGTSYRAGEHGLFRFGVAQCHDVSTKGMMDENFIGGSRRQGADRG